MFGKLKNGVRFSMVAVFVAALMVATCFFPAAVFAGETASAGLPDGAPAEQEAYSSDGQLIAMSVDPGAALDGSPQEGTVLDAQLIGKKVGITFNANGGKMTSGNKKIKTWKKTANYGKAYAAVPGAKGAPKAPVRKGYKFMGWYTQNGASTGEWGDLVAGPGVKKSPTPVNLAQKHTLFARWEPRVYKVTFDVRGGLPAFETIFVTYKKAPEDWPSIDPVRAGFTFDGWFTAKSGGTLMTQSSIAKITKNTKLFAQWTSTTKKKNDIMAYADLTLTGSGTGWHGKIVLMNPNSGTAISFGIQHDSKSALGYPNKDALMFERIYGASASQQLYKAFASTTPGVKHRIGLEYDAKRGKAIGYCDGKKIGEVDSPTMTVKDFVVSFEASSRLTGDTVDARFENLVVDSKYKLTSYYNWQERFNYGSFSIKFINNGGGVPPGAENAGYATKDGYRLSGTARIPGGDWDTHPEVGAKRFLRMWKK